MPRFVRFLAVGVMNTAFGYGVFALLTWAGLPYPLAIAGATIVGIAFNFASTGRLVFGDSGVHRLPRFVLAYAVVYGFNVAAVAGLLSLGLDVYVANAIAVVPAAGLSFLLLSRFVFAKP